MNGFKLYKRYAIINFRCIMQYHTWPISILTTIVNSIVDFLAVIILFARFGNIGNWTSSHVLLLYGIAATSFGLAEWFSRGYDCFPFNVSSGEFDRVLLRPRTTFLQVMGQRFEFQRLGRVTVGICCIIYSIIHLNSYINFTNTLILIGAVAGGWLVYTSIFMLLSALSFWTMQPLDIMYIFTNGTLQYCKVPLPMLGKAIQNLLTFILPLGLCYYYPAMIIAKNTDYPVWTGYMALPGGIIFFIVSLLVWRLGVSHYHSSGS
jgi:ABC-2 type transport system permease protein